MDSIQLRRIQFDHFEWNKGNVEKLSHRGISILEVEVFFEQELLIYQDHRHSNTEDRYIAVGESITGRHLFVAFTFRSKETENFLRVISARYVHRNGKELKFYENLKKGFQKEK